MKVYFIGAGPGAIDLITVRGANVLKKSPIVLYAGSLVSRDITEYCGPDTEIHDTASLNLDEQIELYQKAFSEDRDVARVHSGDPAIYGATGEQMAKLRDLKIDFEIVPGVSSYSAAAAVMEVELTKPNVGQTIILTRTEGRASPMPENESLEALAALKTTLCIFLSGANLPDTLDILKAHYDLNTPIALARRVTWDAEKIHKSTLGKILEEIQLNDWNLTTLLIIGDVMDNSEAEYSKLYSASYSHKFRKAVKA